MLLIAAGSVAHAASFDCAKAATTIEKQICADHQLSALDQQLAQSYKDSRTNSANADLLKSEQRAWLVTVRNRCENAECLRQAYSDRISALAVTPVGQTTELASSPAPSVGAAPGNAESTPISPESTLPTVAIEEHQSPRADSKPPEPPSERSNNDAQVSSASPVQQSGNGSGILNFIVIVLLVSLVFLIGLKGAPRRGNWFVLRKISERDLHGKQVHNDLILCDTEKELLAQSKDVMNELDCPMCGNHKIKGDVTVHYGPVKLFREVKTENGYRNELVSMKWLYYGPKLQSGEHVKCPDCKWEMKSSRFEEFGTKAALVIAASVAAHKMFSKTSR